MPSVKLSNTILDSFELMNEEYLVEPDFYKNRSGYNEYRLYSYLTTFVNNTTILDIGTYTGRSAVALSHNPSNKVISYDIRGCIPSGHKICTKPNLEFRVKNVIDDLTPEFIQNVKIVMIDVDHFGTNERRILDTLLECGYQGIILFDDIDHPELHMKIPMQEFWESVTQPKLDITKYGHFSGTGLVNLSNDWQFELE
jgi:hypothetical protein